MHVFTFSAQSAALAFQAHARDLRWFTILGIAVSGSYWVGVCSLPASRGTVGDLNRWVDGRGGERQAA